MLLKDIAKRAAAPLFGYLVTIYQTDKPGVFQHLSIGNNPYNFRPMNKGLPVWEDTVGAPRIRDPYLVASPDRSDFWIIGTEDLHAKSPAEAQSHGSRSIVVSHSKDLMNWSKTWLLPVESKEAGSVSAPSAFWLEEEKRYFLTWSSNRYAKNDPEHKKGEVNQASTRYATTLDFQKASQPWGYAAMKGRPTTDFEFLRLPNKEYLFLGTDLQHHGAYAFTKKTLFGAGWSGSLMGYLKGSGATAFQDNLDPNEIHLWVDEWKLEKPNAGYVPLEAHFDSTKGSSSIHFLPSSKPISPAGIHQGSVTPLTQAEYNRLDQKNPKGKK